MGNTVTKRALAATLILMAGITAGCGDSDQPAASDPPEPATVEEFCGVFDDFFAEMSELTGTGDEPDQQAMIQAVKGVADRLEEVGSPEDIPDDAQAGLDVTTEALQGLPDDATQQDLAELETDFTEEEQTQTKAFDTYVTSTCEGAGSEEPSDGQ
jgi:hypothetical protein